MPSGQKTRITGSDGNPKQDGELLSKVLELSSAIMAVSTIEDGSFLLVNEAFVEKTGYSHDELMGSTSKELELFVKYADFEAAMKKASNEGAARSMRVDLRAKSGDMLKGFLSAAVIVFEGKSRLLMMFNDMSEPISPRKALSDGEEKYRILAENIAIGILLVALDGRIINANRAAAEILGVASAEDLTGRLAVDFYADPRDRESFLAKLSSSGRLRNHESRIKSGSGSLLWISISAVVLCDERGKPDAVLSAIQDITEKKAAEEKLLASEEKYRMLAESSPEMIYMINTAGVVQYVNAAGLAMFEGGSEAVVGKHLEEIYPPALAERHMKAIRTIISSGRPLFSELIEEFPAGVRWIDARLTPIRDAEGVITGVLGLSQDITHRKRAEEALRESEHRYRSMFEQTNDGFFLHDFEGNILDCNDNMCRMLGYEREELVGAHLSKIDSPQERSLMPERLEKNIETGVLLFDGEHVGKQGNRLSVNISSRVVSREGNGVIQCFVRDMTERKQAEETLRESEKRFRAIFEQASIGIAMSDSMFRFYRVNATFCAMFGYSAEELSAMTFKDITHPDYLETDIESVQKLSRGEIPEYKTQKRYIRKGGEEIWGELNLSVMRDSSGRFLHYLVMVEDVTARRRAEEAMLRTERLESLKVFAGGIAHDFNNLLGGIFGYFDLARHELPKTHPAYDYLDKSFSAFDRARHLARQLLTFARGGAPIKKTVWLPDLICDSCALALSGSNIKSEYSFPEDLWLVDGDENQLAQVFSNLMINACQAMPEGGTVEIDAKNRVLDAGQAGKLKAGRYVTITVRDEGIGMPEEIIGKIFDPFFTTKQRGSGLGLATSHSIVTRHGGHISVASRPGEGSTFTIVLPASERDEADRRDAATGIDLSGVGRVLVMDDEGVLREMIRDLLTRHGYKVAITAEGKEAVETYARALREERRFDLVILDLTVPGGMGGAWALRELKKIDPQVAAIVSSGYSDNAELARFEEQGFTHMVAKPYRIDELLLAVKKAIGAGRERIHHRRKRIRPS